MLWVDKQDAGGTLSLVLLLAGLKELPVLVLKKRRRRGKEEKKEEERERVRGGGGKGRKREGKGEGGGGGRRRGERKEKEGGMKRRSYKSMLENKTMMDDTSNSSFVCNSS